MKIKKNILFISYDGMTDPLGQSQVIPYLAGLTEYGYEFTILSCEKAEKYTAHKNYVEDLLKIFPIKWVPIPYHKKPPVLSSIYDLIKLKSIAKQLHNKEKFDMVHTRAGVPALIGLWMKKKMGVKFLHDIREFYAESRIEGGMWNYNNPFYKRIYTFFKRKEEDEVENCDGIVCLTYAAERIIKQWPQLKKEIPLIVIPCSVDMNLFDPVKINPKTKDALKQELQIKDSDFIISYLGSIGGWYLTDEMMKFCKIASDKIPNSKFLFISPHNHSIIESAAKKFGIPSEKIIVRHGKRHEVPALLSFSNYSLFFIKPCYSKLSSSPTKHGEIMAMGIPVITNSGVGDVKEIVEKYESGFVLEELNQENYKQYSKMLIATNFDSKKIRDGATEFYSLEKAVQKYLKVYKLILNQA
jgi:glycosyltransferase involved in cell wall biosynthesis